MALTIRSHAGKKTLNETGINIIIFGIPGAGKTSLAASFPKVLYIDSEQGTKFIDNQMDVATVKSWSEVKEVIDIVQSGQYETVVFDVIDEIHSLYMEFVKQEKPSLFNSLGVPSIAGWGVLKNGWRKFCKTMCMESTVNTVFVAHEKITQDDNGNVIRVSPKLMGSAASELVGFVDFCGFKPDKFSIDFRETGVVRDVKDRHGKFLELDSPIYNPTYTLLSGIVNGTVSATVATFPAKFTSLSQAYEACEGVGFNKEAVDAILSEITSSKKAVVLRDIIFEKLLAKDKKMK